MMRVFDDTYLKDWAKSWREYIKSAFTSKEKFIEENMLDDYFENGEVKTFWYRTQTFGYKKAIDSEWESYFRNVKDAIENRNMKIQKRAGE